MRNEDSIRRLSAADPSATAGTGEPSQERRGSIRAAALSRIEGADKAGSEQTASTGSGSRTRLGPKLRLGLAGGALAALTGALILTLGGGGNVVPGSDPQFAKAAVAIAESSPRLLIGEPGWRVSDVGEFEPDFGDMTFANDGEKVDVMWVPDELWGHLDIKKLRNQARYEALVSQNHGMPVHRHVYEKVTVLGREGVLSYEVGRGNFYVALPPGDGTVLQFYADGRMDLSREQFLEVVGSLHQVDVDTWLAALPRDTVRPEDHTAAVDGMLEGLPIPDDVDVQALRSEDLAMDRYDLGAHVSGAIACGWLDQWADAERSGDEASQAQATRALAGAKEWPILQEMRSQGGWSQVIWGYANHAEKGHVHRLLGTAGTQTLFGGPTYAISPAYASGLGCDSKKLTLVPEDR